MDGPRLSRRSLLASAGAAAGLAALAPAATGALAAGGVVEARLRAAPARAALVGGGYPDTAVWAYSGSVPGPLLRVPQGGRLRVAVENALPLDTTVHWHGLRIPIAMDGVPGISQPPIAPGETFVYDFEAKDAGTFWYHPHVRGFEQVERGLSGVLIVDEPAPPVVDRDELWVLDDWRLDQEAQVTDDFEHPMDMSHAGRIGNTVTVGGRIAEQVSVRVGERVRLRLVNVANARHFALAFEGHRPLVVAYDGQPVAPHAPEDGVVVLGPAMRADVILDMEGRPGERVALVDRFYRGREYRLLDLAYDQGAILRENPLDAPRALAPNPVPEPDLRDALRAEIVFEGGMMGAMSAATMNGRITDIRTLMRAGKMWAVNGVVAVGEAMEPTLIVPLGRTAHLTLLNRTAWPHPIHLHGHHFRVLSRNGAPTPHREWRDTVLLLPEDQVEIAFVADNPGDWLLHCHVLEHMAGGMLAVVRVA